MKFPLGRAKFPLGRTKFLLDFFHIKMDYPDLVKRSAAYLRDLALQADIRIPWDLETRPELAQYIYGCYLERMNGIEAERRNNPVLLLKSSLVPTTQILDERYQTWSRNTGRAPWVGHFLDKGWAIVPLTGFEADAVLNAYLDFLVTCSPNFSKEDRSTWVERNLPTLREGSIRYYACQSAWMWYARYVTAPYFADLWQVPPKQLLTSFETPFLLTGEGRPGETPFLLTKETSEDFRQNFRTNNPREALNMSLVEGHVFLTDCGPEEGGLVILEGSVAHSGNYLQRQTSEGISIESRINLLDPVVSKLPMSKLCCNKGDLLLTDSRIISTRVSGPNPQLGLKISMAPRVAMRGAEKEFAKQITNRQVYYRVGRVTGAHPIGPLLRAMPPIPTMFERPRNFPPTLEVSPLTELGVDLVGREYEDNSAQLVNMGWISTPKTVG